MTYQPPTEHYSIKRKLDLPKLPEEPCGEDCFLHVEKLRSSIENLFTKKKNKSTKADDVPGLMEFVNSQAIVLEPKPWTSSDLVLLKRLCPLYKVGLTVSNA